MAGTELGKAWVEVVPSARDLEGNLIKMFDPAAKTAGESSGNKFAGTLKKVLAGAGIGAAFKKTLDFGAELQQNLGGTEAVFGDYASKIQTAATQAYKNMGLSASDYMATANKMGSLFQGSGVEQTKALQMTEDAMQRAADVASVMGIDTSMAMESIAGAAKGNFTMMDNLGVAMNATTLQAYALEKGLNFDWNTADNAQKAELAMQMFMERTSQYENNFAKESEETLSGSLGAMKAAAQDLMGNLVLGENVGPAMNNLVETAVTAAGNLIPAIGNILQGLPGVVSTAIDTLVPELTNALKSAADTVKTKFPQMLKSALQNLMEFSGNIRSKAGELADAGLELIKNIATGIIKNIPTIVETVPTIISNFAGVINDNAPKILATGVSIIKNLVAGLIKAIPVIIANLPKIIAAIWDVFMAIQWLKLGKTLIEGIGKGIKSAAAGIKNLIKDIVNVVKELIHGGFTAAKKAALKVFESMKTGIREKFDSVVDIIKGIIEKIKGMFPFSLGKLFSGKVELPSVSVSKNGDGGASTNMSVRTQEFAKAMSQPYMFTRPTIFEQKVAGEAGDEMLYGRTNLMKDIREATNGNNGDIIINLNYNASDDANDMRRDIARGVQRYKMAGVI